MDVDRSYFVRNGFYDRLYNPRAAAQLFRFLNTVFQLHPPDSVTRDGANLSIASGESKMSLCMDGRAPDAACVQCLDLITGTMETGMGSTPGNHPLLAIFA